MAATKTYNGFIYEQQADGSWKRGAPAGPQMPADPTFDLERPKAVADLTNTQTNIADTAVDNQRAAADSRFSHVTKLANDFNGDPSVKAYRVAIGQFGQAINTGVGPQADLALTYAFAKAMDPDSVVRESEQGMVVGSQARLDALAEKIKKEFGYSEAGGFTPEARTALRKQISNSVAQRAKVYDARRSYYEKQAGALGVDPDLIVGQHDAEPFVPAIQDWVKQVNGPAAIEKALKAGASREELAAIAAEHNLAMNDDQLDANLASRARGGPTNTVLPPEGGDFIQSPLQQGVYGFNEGMASTLGLPVDLLTAGMNLVPKGINALANTDIPEITNPVGGSDWMQDKFKDIGFVGSKAETTGGLFARRTGQSIGATATALPLGGAAAVRQAAIPLASGAGGGMAAAGAQQVFPGNPTAEFGAEVVGSGLTGAGLLRGAQRGAQRKLDEAVPTVADLKDTAGDLYARAERNGVTASPQMTRQLHDDFANTLRREGQLGPQGSITNADTSTSKAYNLLGQYADQPMRPSEMDTVRRVIADGRKSTEPGDQRLSGIMLDQFDDWTRPLAPEFDEARSVASRYLQAEDLEQARELAGARAGQFTGSGYENALRTEYRGLDRANIKGRNHFDPAVVDALQKVSRGTPGSNFARNVGRFAARGPVSAGLGVGGPALVGGAIGGPTGALMAGGGAFALGEAGRAAATRMGLRAAEVAELTARNGGKLSEAPILPPNMREALLAQAVAQLQLYNGGVEEPAADDAGGGAGPQALAGAIRRPSPRSRGLLGRPR